MEFASKIGPPSICSLPRIPALNYLFRRNSSFSSKIGRENQTNDAVLLCSRFSSQAVCCAARSVHRRIGSVESRFSYDKPIPEEIIEKPIGLSLALKDIGENPHCPSCQTKGVNLCTTCAGSGLYVDSILESQGIIVKVRCLGCGGNGNTMCSDCGGRGHI